MNLQKTRMEVNKTLNKFQAAKEALKEERKSLTMAEASIMAAEEAQQLGQLVSKRIQERAHEKIAGIVSRCLSAVFEEPYQFHILFESKRGKTEARLVFQRDGQEVDPMSASGGGVVDVAAFALRLSCLLLSRPPLQRVLILDEPFKFLSEKYRGRIRELLEGLAEELGVQIIMVTHIKELETGKIFNL